MSTRLASAVVVSLLACACSSPTTPTLTPLPVTNPPATPAPVKPTLTFTPESSTPVANSYTLSADTTTAGEITLTMNANAFASTRHVAKVRATLLYDPDVLVEDSGYIQGDWMKQNNALAVFTIGTYGAGQLGLWVDRPDSLPGVNGSGAIVSKRFTVARGVRNRTTPVQWTDTHAFNVGGLSGTQSLTDLLVRDYAGMITIQ